jgi:hypothetical protein
MLRDVEMHNAPPAMRQYDEHEEDAHVRDTAPHVPAGWRDD